MAGEISKIKTPELLDEEARQAAEHRKKISHITLEVEEIFLREDITMGDLGEIIDMFNSRAHFVFSKTKVKDVKKSYDGLN